MAEFTDQIGNVLSIDKSPMRIVSLVPSITELLYDLGLEDRIVGITKFCVHPNRAKATTTIIGGTKKVHFEKIRLLKPDIIIANKEENTIEIVQQLQQFCNVWVTNIITLDDNAQMITDFGTLFNCRTEAQKLNDKISFARSNFENFMADKPIRKVAYFIWREPYMAAGGDNFINTMLQLNKLDNIYKDRGRYPEVELKKIRIYGDPDYVLLSSEPFPFNEEHAFEIGRFTHHAKTVFVDGEMFSWYGSRIVKAFSYFTTLQHRIN